MHQVAWSVKIDALAAYRATYGNCNVSASYVTPTSVVPPWTPPLLGMPLGAIVAKLRSSSKLLDVDRARDLDNIGFIWSQTKSAGRCTKLDQYGRPVNVFVRWATQVDALAVYYAILGTCDNMPSDFAVPTDSGLWPSGATGVLLASVKTCLRRHFYELDDAHCRRLHALGVLAHLPRWPVLLSLLDLYRRLHGHCRIPLEYIVSGTDWPVDAVGLPLGVLAFNVGLRQASLSRDRCMDLATVRLELSTHDTWRNILDAVRVYGECFGTRLVRRGFVVPSSSQWPASLHQRRLAFWTKRLDVAHKLLLLSTETVAAMARLDATPVPPPGLDHQRGLWHCVYMALDLFRATHGHVRVPVDYVVPAGPTTPTPIRGFRLGNAVALLQQQETMDPEHRRCLNALGFVWCHDAQVSMEASYEDDAMWGVDNSDDDGLPPHDEDAGLDLSYASPASAPTATVAAPEQPLDLEVPMVVVDDSMERNMTAALAVYERITGHKHVSPTFVVSVGHAGWPAHLWALSLGALLAAARPRLPNVVVDWSICLPGLRHYKDLVDSTDIPRSFVVPHSPQWPADLHGHDIGRMLDDVRHGRVLVPRSVAFEMEALSIPLRLPSAE